MLDLVSSECPEKLFDYVSKGGGVFVVKDVAAVEFCETRVWPA